MQRPVSFYSEGLKLDGDLYLPEGAKASDRRAGIVLCHGYTGVKDLYLPDNARVLNAAGYVVLTFDYKGWGKSEGPRSRLAPYGRVADVQAAMTFLGLQPEVDADRLGLYGTSYGGATVVWVAALDPAPSASSPRRRRPWRALDAQRAPARRVRDLLARAKADRERRVIDGTSAEAERAEILALDRQSAALAAAARKANPNALNTLPAEFIDETLAFHPEWVVDKIAPRPVLFITTDDDRVVPAEETLAMHARCGEPKQLVVLKGVGHYQVYAEPAFSALMAPTVAWFQSHIPARG